MSSKHFSYFGVHESCIVSSRNTGGLCKNKNYNQNKTKKKKFALNIEQNSKAYTDGCPTNKKVKKIRNFFQNAASMEEEGGYSRAPWGVRQKSTAPDENHRIRPEYTIILSKCNFTENAVDPSIMSRKINLVEIKFWIFGK